MATSIAVTSNPESFVFASNNDLVTDSFKVAEAFGKSHRNVLRDVKKIISSIEKLISSNVLSKDEVAKLNFELCFQNNELQNGKPQPFYKMNQDGFMLVVMGYTGLDAMAIKMRYINAFNFMRAKLFPPATLQLEPPTITKAQWGEINARVSEIADLTDEPKKTKLALWSRFNKHFRIGGYKELPREKFDDAIAYLELKKLNYPATKEPEMKPTALNGWASMILGINGNQRLVLQEHNDVTVVMKLNDEDFVGSFETVVRELKMQGYVVMKKDDLADKLSVLVA